MVKVGDKVRCVLDGISVTADKVYEVRSVDAGGTMFILDDDGDLAGYAAPGEPCSGFTAEPAHVPDEFAAPETLVVTFNENGSVDEVVEDAKDAIVIGPFQRAAVYVLADVGFIRKGQRFESE